MNNMFYKVHRVNGFRHSGYVVLLNVFTVMPLTTKMKQNVFINLTLIILLMYAHYVVENRDERNIELEKCTKFYYRDLKEI
jgi:hypothetical protein